MRTTEQRDPVSYEDVRRLMERGEPLRLPEAGYCATACGTRLRGQEACRDGRCRECRLADCERQADLIARRAAAAREHVEALTSRMEQIGWSAADLAHESGVPLRHVRELLALDLSAAGRWPGAAFCCAAMDLRLGRGDDDDAAENGSGAFGLLHALRRACPGLDDALAAADLGAVLRAVGVYEQPEVVLGLPAGALRAGVRAYYALAEEAHRPAAIPLVQLAG